MSSFRPIGLVYGLIFAATGVSLPFAGLWFESRGLSGAEIAVILAAPMLARIVSGPLIAVWADGFRLRRTALAWLSVVAGLAYAACGVAQGLGSWLGLWFVAATAAASTIPLMDALALRLARREGFAFAGVRGVGSLTFIGANVAMGLILRAASPDAILAWVVMASMLAALAAVSMLPAEPVSEDPAPGRGRARFEGLGRLVGDRVFMTAMAGVGLIQASHAFYYGFSAISWKAQGISTRDVGLLWGASVVAELVLLWGLEPLRRRHGVRATTLLWIAGAAAVARWGALSLSPPAWALWPLQALHALSFAAVFLVSLQIVEALVPPHHATAGQTLYSSLSAGLFMGLATVISGPLYDAYGALGYLGMAGLAALGLGLAWSVRDALARVG